MHLRQAIVTKYHGPTNTRGSRISATAAAGRIFIPYDHALSIQENHAAAARAYATKWGWHSRYVGGVMASGDYSWASFADADCCFDTI